MRHLALALVIALQVVFTQPFPGQAQTGDIEARADVGPTGTIANHQRIAGGRKLTTRTAKMYRAVSTAHSGLWFPRPR